MSLIKLGDRTWASVNLEGVDFSDANFANLGYFEELLPTDQSSLSKKSKTTEKKKLKKQKVKNNEAETTESKAPEKKSKKRKKEVKETAVKPLVEADEALEVEKQTPNTKTSIKKKQISKKQLLVQEIDDSEPEVKRRRDEFEASNTWKEFGLPDEISLALADMQFSTPTEIQRLVIPSAVRDRLDIVGAAETGSGKTLAYTIPAICRILEEDEEERTKKGLRALIIAPTRELVVQVKQHVDNLLRHTKLKSVSVVGGLAQPKQERLLKSYPEVMVATPGRLWSLINAPCASTYFSDVSTLRALVIDEADRMIERGHFEELELILSHVKRFTNEKLQTMVFSATLTYVHPAPKWMNEQKSMQLSPQEKLKRLIEITGVRKERKIFDITRSFGTAENLVETRLNCDGLLEKDIALVYLLTRYRGRTLIFMNSVDAARRLFGILSKLRTEPTPLLLHARMQQRQRLKNLERFAGNSNSILLATDVAARGLDIRGIEHVIHYQVPKTAELYIHRSGRTARASSSGLTVLLVDPQDASFYRRICYNLNREKDLPVFPVDSEDLLTALKLRVKLAAELDSIEHRIKKKRDRSSWFEKAAKEADLELDEFTSEAQGNDAELTELHRDLRTKTNQLKAALSYPLPNTDQFTMPKTKYITAELSKLFDERKSEEAIGSFKADEFSKQMLKKKARKLLKGRHFRKRKH